VSGINGGRIKQLRPSGPTLNHAAEPPESLRHAPRRPLPHVDVLTAGLRLRKRGRRLERLQGRERRTADTASIAACTRIIKAGKDQGRRPRHTYYNRAISYRPEDDN
jgi:hypothetical protein